MSVNSQTITSPDHPALGELCTNLAQLSNHLDRSDVWPAESLRLCGEFGVFRWFVSRAMGGLEWNESDLVRGYLRLSAACLTTTFIITQRTGACQRIERSGNEAVKQLLLPGLVSGERFATLGISHLTTSRRHLAQPAMRATETSQGFVLDGYSPWVTGASAADYVVLGATLEDSRQILVALPTRLPGVEISEPTRLLGLASSQTGPVKCSNVTLERKWLLAGPVDEVMKQGVGARTGGLQTSTLALGLAASALQSLQAESARRDHLAHPAAALQAEFDELGRVLMRAAEHQPICSDAELRSRANSLALRASQAALAAAKGTGYVDGHPTGRWCREALFFLVWSCPQPVLDANLCEFAGLAEPEN